MATKKANLNQIPMGRDPHSLVLRHDGTVYHNNEEKNRLPANSLPQEGDIVVSLSSSNAHVKLIWDLLLVNKSICVCASIIDCDLI